MIEQKIENPSWEEVKALIFGLGKRSAELDEEYRKRKEESDEQHKRNLEAIDKSVSERIERSNKEANKKHRELETLFKGQWGKLVECLIEGPLVSLLNERGIEIIQTSQRVGGFCEELDKQYEYDIIAHNGDTVVIVEVKTTLSVDDVKDFLEKMQHIRITLKIYKNPKKYVGALAYLTTNAAAHVFAENQGLFVIKAVGNSAKIINKKDFLPKVF